MEESLSAFELEFKRVASDLEFVGHRLENEFRNRSDIPNVVSLVRRLHALGPKLATLRIKSDRLEEQRSAVVMQTVAALMQNFSALVEVQNDCGISKENSSGDNAQTVDAKGDLSSTLSKCAWLAPADLAKVCVPETKQTAAAPSSSSGGGGRKTATLLFNEETFLAVPASIRGRSKFETARDLLERLQTLHTSNRALLPRGAPDAGVGFDAAGIKGKAGLTSCKVLERAGLITINAKTSAVHFTSHALRAVK